MKDSIKAYSYEDLRSLFEKLGQPKFRVDQLVQWLYSYGVSDYQDMTNLPKSLRETLAAEFPIYSPRIIDKRISKDGSRKYVLEFHDGCRVETVAMPSKTPSQKAIMENALSGSNAELVEASSNDFSLRQVPAAAVASSANPVCKTSSVTTKTPASGTSSSQKSTSGRLSVCVSTQSGCAMECSFCATGKEGFTRNLLPGEIVDQVLAVQADFGSRVSNVVTMGQGEPFLNYDNTLAALRFLNSSKGLEIGARHITISTCGIIPGIDRLSAEPEQFTLAVSLHSAQQEIRDLLMPRVANEKLPQLKAALCNYVSRTNRRVSLEYLLIDGLTDTKEALRALESFCEGLLCHINLIPINSIDGSPYKPSKKTAADLLLARLESLHIPVTIRDSRGSDIAGACGQLKNSL